MSFPVKRPQKCPRNLPIRVKGIAPTKILAKNHKKALNLVGTKNYFVIGSSLSRVRFIRKLKDQSESADPCSGIGGRDFDIRGRNASYL